jgi:hypothetical protein
MLSQEIYILVHLRSATARSALFTIFAVFDRFPQWTAIVAKLRATVTRDEKDLPKKAWKKVWHDHSVEGVIGNVKVLDMPPDKAKEFADAVAKTDGIIFSLWPEDAKLPTGKVSIGMMGWACRTPMTCSDAQWTVVPTGRPEMVTQSCTTRAWNNGVATSCVPSPTEITKPRNTRSALTLTCLLRWHEPDQA